MKRIMNIIIKMYKKLFNSEKEKLNLPKKKVLEPSVSERKL
jgi:hypothetical protein